MPARRQTLRERTEPELEVVLGVTALAGSNPALEQEFRSSLQVVSAAVFALDGFYGVIQEHVGIAAAELAARRANRTSRPKWGCRCHFPSRTHPGQRSLDPPEEHHHQLQSSRPRRAPRTCTPTSRSSSRAQPTRPLVRRNFLYRIVTRGHEHLR